MAGLLMPTPPWPKERNLSTVTDLRPSERGFAAICDERGHVKEILRDDLGLLAAQPEALTHVIAARDRPKFEDFLKTAMAGAAPVGLPLSVAFDGQVQTLHFCAAEADGRVFVVAAPDRAFLAHFNDVFVRASRNKSARLRQALQASIKQLDARSAREVANYDDLSQLNNELARAQRRLIKTNQRLGESEQRFRAIFATVSDGIFVYDESTGARIEANQSVCDMFGYTRDEILKCEFGSLSSGVPPYTRDEARQRFDTARAGVPQAFEWQSKAKDGRVFFTDMTLRKLTFGDRECLVSTVHDITERKANATKILQLARFDGLTGLANRGVFAEAVARGIAMMHRENKEFAVLYIDLDHFKDINDTLGHPIGDALLKLVARRLQAAARDSDTVARFGGDEFAVMQASIEDPTDAGLLAERLLSSLSQPYIVDDNEITSGASIGIAIYGPDGGDAEALLARADVALYRAKAEGRGIYRFFTDAMDAEVRTRVSLGNDLRSAIGSDELFLEYQPQVEAATGRIIGVEAEIRWRHPQRGIVAPADFIPVAERNGLILTLGHWVLREACRQAKDWRDAGIPPVVMAVNVSSLQFKSLIALENDIQRALAEFGLPAEMLELELTESTVMNASQHHNGILVRMRALGLRLAIDDFGAGYSSLDHLRRFPFDRIKIAQKFIVGLGVTPEYEAIVRAAIGIAREFGIATIATGVATEEQLTLLRKWGCGDIQGYYFSGPLSAADAAPLLRHGRINVPLRLVS
jgi:diguanylate cyclase (GGDEF)-like protein/PAS domain S-box-containing protein